MFDVSVNNKAAKRFCNRFDLLLTADGILSLKTQLCIANNLAVREAGVSLSQFLVGDLDDRSAVGPTPAAATCIGPCRHYGAFLVFLRRRRCKGHLVFGSAAMGDLCSFYTTASEAYQ